MTALESWLCACEGGGWGQRILPLPKVEFFVGFQCKVLRWEVSIPGQENFRFLILRKISELGKWKKRFGDRAKLYSPYKVFFHSQSWKNTTESSRPISFFNSAGWGGGGGWGMCGYGTGGTRRKRTDWLGEVGVGHGGIWPETHTKRQVTQHGCLPSLLDDGGQGHWNSARWGKKYIWYLVDL